MVNDDDEDDNDFLRDEDDDINAINKKDDENDSLTKYYNYMNLNESSKKEYSFQKKETIDYEQFFDVKEENESKESFKSDFQKNPIKNKLVSKLDKSIISINNKTTHQSQIIPNKPFTKSNEIDEEEYQSEDNNLDQLNHITEKFTGEFSQLEQTISENYSNINQSEIMKQSQLENIDNKNPHVILKESMNLFKEKRNPLSIHKNGFYNRANRKTNSVKKGIIKIQFDQKQNISSMDLSMTNFGQSSRFISLKDRDENKRFFNKPSKSNLIYILIISRF